MSHFTKLDKANVTDVEAFLQACAAMGMTRVLRNVEMQAWAVGDKPVRVDVCAHFPGNKYGIGLIKNARGTYDMVSDWSLTGSYLAPELRGSFPPGFPGTDGPGNSGHAACEAFRGRILRDVTSNAIVRRYSKQGFRAMVTEDEDHNLNVVLVRA